MLKAGPAACWLWVCGLAHCQSQLSDGFIPTEVLPMIGIQGMPRAQRLAAVLVDVGLWEPVDGGYVVHDYHAFNETKADAIARRADLSAKRSLAGRNGGLASQANQAKDKQQVEANLKQELATYSKPHPIPSHPIQRDPTDLSERAARLLDNYGVWYQRDRHGARIRLLRNSLEFSEASSLVALWDDARLEKIAKIVLTTDDPFVTGTDRGWKIFVLKASWADDRLKQWELANGVTV